MEKWFLVEEYYLPVKNQQVVKYLGPRKCVMVRAVLQAVLFDLL